MVVVMVVEEGGGASCLRQEKSSHFEIFKSLNDKNKVPDGSIRGRGGPLPRRSLGAGRRQTFKSGCLMLSKLRACGGPGGPPQTGGVQRRNSGEEKSNY